MSITVTQAAANHIRRMLETKDGGLGLRLGVKKSGCSGYAYVLDFAMEIAANDEVYECLGIKLVVNAESVSFLNGLELDYVKEGLNQSFKFNNPNVKDSCGCGESFSV